MARKTAGRTDLAKGMITAAAALMLVIAAAQDVRAAETLKVSETVKLDAPVTKVWSIVGNFPILTWHPAVKSSSATKGNAAGSTRQVDLGGPVLVEELVKRDVKDHSYTYKILDNGLNQQVLPVSHYLSTISVKQSGTGSVVTWSSTFEPAPGAAPAEVQKTVQGIYRGGLDNLPKLLAQQ